MEEECLDEILEFRKRKRLERGDRSHAIATVNNPSDNYDTEFGADINYFLTATPGGEDRRGQ